LPEYPILIPVWREVTFAWRATGEPMAVVLSCDEKQLEALLCMASLHCPEALPMIQKALDHPDLDRN
jgi:hypothetical protein